MMGKFHFDSAADAFVNQMRNIASDSECAADKTRKTFEKFNVTVCSFTWRERNGGVMPELRISFGRGRLRITVC